MNGQFALYESPRAGSVKLKVTGKLVTLVVSVLGILVTNDGIRYLIVGSKDKQGDNPRFVRGAEVDLYVGPASYLGPGS